MNLEQAKFIIASGPVILEDDKVLLNRHGHNDKDDKKEKRYWKFPGGRIKELDIVNDDSLEKACKREVREEMGIDVKIIKPLKPMIIRYPHNTDTVVILIHYLAKRIGEIKPGVDIEEYKWFPVNNLPANCASNIEPVLRTLKR